MVLPRARADDARTHEALNPPWLPLIRELAALWRRTVAEASALATPKRVHLAALCQGNRVERTAKGMLNRVRRGIARVARHIAEVDALRSACVRMACVHARVRVMLKGGRPHAETAEVRAAPCVELAGLGRRARCDGERVQRPR